MSASRTNDSSVTAIDNALVAFKAELRRDHTTTIEKHLESAPGGLREQLFGKLLDAELTIRAASGSVPRIADYETRFPNRKAEIRRTFNQQRNRDEATLAVDEQGTKGQPKETPRTDSQQSNQPQSENATAKPDGSKRLIGSFEVIQRVGKGGMGVV